MISSFLATRYFLIYQKNTHYVPFGIFLLTKMSLIFVKLMYILSVCDYFFTIRLYFWHFYFYNYFFVKINRLCKHIIRALKH